MEIVSYNSYAGFFKRFVAFIIDSMLVRIGLGMLLFGTNPIKILYDYDMLQMVHHQLSHGIWVEVLTMAYFVICETSAWQATLGKRLMGLKVVSLQYEKIKPATAMWRYTWKYLSALVFMLGYIWVIFDAKKQGWHDKLAGTYVIEA